MANRFLFERGPWLLATAQSTATNTTYVVGNIVTHSDETWYCLTNNTIEEPSSTATDWRNLLSANIDLTSYVTDTSLETTLEDYPTETELTTILDDYPTETELTTTLGGYPTTAEQTTAITTAIAAIDLDGVDFTLLQGAEDTSTTPSTFGPDVYPAAAAFIAAGLPESSVTGDYDLTVGTRIAAFGSSIANYEVITAVAVTPGSAFALNPSDIAIIAPTGTPVASWDTVVEDKDIEDFVEADFVNTAVFNSQFALSISESVDFLQPSSAAGTQVHLQAAVEQIHISGMEFAPGGATGTVRFTDLLTAQDLTEHEPFPAQVSPATAASRLYVGLNIPNTDLLVILELQHSLFLDSNGDNNVAINTDYAVSAVLVYEGTSPIATNLLVSNAIFMDRLGTDGYINVPIEIYELTRVSLDPATLSATKQDNVIAGSNITINNNVISSSGVSLGSGDDIDADATFEGTISTGANSIEIVPFGPVNSTVAGNITAGVAWLNAVLYTTDVTQAQLLAGVATTAPGLLHRGNGRVEIPTGTTISISSLSGHITIGVAGAAATFPSSSQVGTFHLTSEETEHASGNAHVIIAGDGVAWDHDGDQYTVTVTQNVDGITVGSGIAGLASIELNGVHSEVADHLVINPTDNSTGTGITALNNWLVETLFFSSAAFVVDVERSTEREATLTRGTASLVIPVGTAVTLTATVRARFEIDGTDVSFPNQATVAGDYTLATNEENVVDGTSHLTLFGGWIRDGIASYEYRPYHYSVGDEITFDARFVGNSTVPQAITTTAGTERSIAGIVSHRLRAFNSPNSTFDSATNVLTVPRDSFSSSFTEHVETANSHYAVLVEDNLKWYLYTGPIPASGNIVYNVISVDSDTLDQQGILDEVVAGPDLERAAGYILLEEQVTQTNALTDAERLKLNSFNTSLVGSTVVATFITANNNSTATGSERRLRAPNNTFYDWVYFPLTLPEDDQFRGLIEAIFPTNAINIGQSFSLNGDPAAIVTAVQGFVINNDGTTTPSANSVFRFTTSAEARTDIEALTVDHVGTNGINFYLNAGANILSFNEFTDHTDLHLTVHARDDAGDDISADINLTALGATTGAVTFTRFYPDFQTFVGETETIPSGASIQFNQDNSNSTNVPTVIADVLHAIVPDSGTNTTRIDAVTEIMGFTFTATPGRFALGSSLVRKYYSGQPTPVGANRTFPLARTFPANRNWFDLRVPGTYTDTFGDLVDGDTIAVSNLLLPFFYDPDQASNAGYLTAAGDNRRQLPAPVIRNGGTRFHSFWRLNEVLGVPSVAPSVPGPASFPGYAPGNNGTGDNIETVAELFPVAGLATGETIRAFGTPATTADIGVGVANNADEFMALGPVNAALVTPFYGAYDATGGWVTDNGFPVGTTYATLMAGAVTGGATANKFLGQETQVTTTLTFSTANGGTFTPTAGSVAAGLIPV